VPYGQRQPFIDPQAGCQPAPVAEGNGEDTFPTWSPDGSRIAFTSDRIGKVLAIFVMKSDGTDVKRFVRTIHETTGPAWSRDGRWIAYTEWRPDGSDAFVVPSTGALRCG
jgi:TolB protein